MTPEQCIQFSEVQTDEPHMLYVTLITLLVLAIGTSVLLRATKQVVDGYEDAEGFHALVPTAVQPSHGANAEQPGVTRIVGPASLV